MKHIILPLLIVLSAFSCFAQSFPKKQTLISLSNVNGVPFDRDDDPPEIVIDGFDIDSHGNFYFFGRYGSGCLAVFSGNKLIYRKTYKGLSASQIFLYKNRLYTFNNTGKNDLNVIDASNGTLIKSIKAISKQHFNSFKFVDSSLVTQVLTDPTDTYQQFDLSGKYLKQAPNELNIPASIIPDTIHTDLCVLIGRYKNNYVFWGLVSNKDTDSEKFWLVDKSGKLLSSRTLPEDDKLFGKDYYEDFPTEHYKVRYGKLYVLGRRGNSALITEISVADLFGLK